MMLMTEVWMVFYALIFFQVKHFIADYPLQTPYMLKKFGKGTEWILPLTAHAAVHGALTLIFILAIKPAAWPLALVDFGVHFIVDRIKASPHLGGRWKSLGAAEIGPIIRGAGGLGNLPELEMYRKMCVAKLKDNTYFWWALGADQMAHHLTHYYIIYMLVFG